MERVSLWFERKFDFSFPVEMHPNLCARLRGTPARLEEILQVPRELLVRRQGDMWSIQEHAGHLLDLEPLWLARVDDYSTDKAELTSADLSNRKTHEAGHNDHPVAEILAGFQKARRKLMNRVEQLDSKLFARTLLHPRLKKPMRLVDHLYFVAEHDDHHLARIWELIQEGRESIRN
jgi:uncharacterized damage-inducible protein DinB